MHVSLERRAQKGMKPAHDVRGIQKSQFFHSFGRPTSTKWVAPASSKFEFHHSSGHPMSTKPRKGYASARQIRISPQFWASDEHEVTKGLRPRAQEFAFHHGFGRHAGPQSLPAKLLCFPMVGAISLKAKFPEFAIHHARHGLSDVDSGLCLQKRHFGFSGPLTCHSFLHLPISNAPLVRGLDIPDQKLAVLLAALDDDTALKCSFHTSTGQKFASENIESCATS